MMKDIHEIYKEAGRLHGHYCPGLASGVRAGLTAAEILNVNPEENQHLWCIYEKPACFADGVQWTFNTSVGKGNLIYHPTGKAVFSFYDGDSGKSVRLSLKNLGLNMSRDEQTEYILNAPAEELFDIGETRLPCPQRKARVPYGICDCCGEETDKDKLILKDGKKLCMDCAEL